LVTPTKPPERARSRPVPDRSASVSRLPDPAGPKPRMVRLSPSGTVFKRFDAALQEKCRAVEEKVMELARDGRREGLEARAARALRPAAQLIDHRTGEGGDARLVAIGPAARAAEEAAVAGREPRAPLAPRPRTAAAHAGIDRREEAEHAERAELEPEHGVPHLVLRPAGEIVERRPGEIEELVGGLASDDDGSQEADDVRRRDVSAKRPAQSAPRSEERRVG